MDNEKEKKKELEKRGEDTPDTGKSFPGSAMTKDQREDAEKVKNEVTSEDIETSSEDVAPEKR